MPIVSLGASEASDCKTDLFLFYVGYGKVFSCTNIQGKYDILANVSNFFWQISFTHVPIYHDKKEN